MDLFIIGNGFDLAHGLKTTYSDFRTFLEINDPGYLHRFEELFNEYRYEQYYLWSDFEEHICFPEHKNVQRLKELISYVERLHIKLREWIETIKLNTQERMSSKINPESDDIFISFNYTMMLEELYEIDEKNIWHIHGSIKEKERNLIIGHYNIPNFEHIKHMYYGEKLEDDEHDIYEQAFYYQTKTLKYDHFIPFSNVLKNINQVHIIGHSLGFADEPFFYQLGEMVGENVDWNVYYYDEPYGYRLNMLFPIAQIAPNIKDLPLKTILDLA